MAAPSRNTYVDILKGLLIFSVVINHSALALKAGEHLSIGPYSFLPYFCPFDMPLFMAIAGYFFYFSCRKRTWQEILVNRFSMILIPCVVWNWLVQLTRVAMDHHCSTLGWLPGGIWFLWSLLGCCALTVLLHNVLGSKGWIGALVLVGASFFIGKDNNNIGYMFPFFYMGYLTSRWELLKYFRWWQGALALVILAGLYALLGTPFTKGWSIWISHTYLFGPMGLQRHAELYLYRMGLGFFGCIGFAWFVSVLCRCCRRLPELCSPCRAVYRALLALGEYSLAVYCIQSLLVETILKQAMLSLISHLGYNPLTEHPGLFFSLILPGTTVVLLLLCLGVHRVLSRRETVSRLLFGK